MGDALVSHTLFCGVQSDRTVDGDTIQSRAANVPANLARHRLCIPLSPCSQASHRHRPVADDGTGSVGESG
jgi:hypothetical protein